MKLKKSINDINLCLNDKLRQKGRISVDVMNVNNGMK